MVWCGVFWCRLSGTVIGRVYPGRSGGLPITFGPRPRVCCRLWSRRSRSSCWASSRATLQAALPSTQWVVAVLSRSARPGRCQKVHTRGIVELKAQVLMCFCTFMLSSLSYSIVFLQYPLFLCRNFHHFLLWFASDIVTVYCGFEWLWCNHVNQHFSSASSSLALAVFVVSTKVCLHFHLSCFTICF